MPFLSRSSRAPPKVPPTSLRPFHTLDTLRIPPGHTMQMPESSVTPKSNGVTAHDINDHTANGAADPATLEALQTVSVIVLRQAVDFLNDSITTDDQLTFRSKYIPGSTIGESVAKQPRRFRGTLGR